MDKISILADNILSPLGNSTASNIEAMLQGDSGIQKQAATDLLPFDYYASKFSDTQIDNLSEKFQIDSSYSRLEKMCLVSIKEAMSNLPLDLSSAELGFIVSTTKGNIDLLSVNNKDQQGKFLYNFANNVSQYFNNPNKPIVISNACISGVLGIITAKRLLRIGHYKHIILVGADLISDFTLSGFYALKAMSSDICKPFDKNRKGINLGEAASCMILSREGNGEMPISICGGASSNDANHISGPSRTGAGMIAVIKSSFAQIENFQKEKIDFISAHGTGTLYNDEMESKAFNHFKLNDVPLNSFKGYFGHTLGAAGILESILSYQSLLTNNLFASRGFSEQGTTEVLNVLKQNEKKDNLSWALKTASGFGGCNAAILFNKLENV